MEKPLLPLVNRDSFAHQLRQLIYEAAIQVVGKRLVKPEEVILEHPINPENGDYATNVAMRSFAKQDKVVSAGEKILTPVDLANKIVVAWRSQGLPEFVAKVEVAAPGFINIWLQNGALIKEAQRVLEEKDGFGQLTVLKGKKVLLEHTSPDPIKTLHIGHLRNNFLGMSMARILEKLGGEVVKDCINNDRGIHVSQTIWGYLVFAKKGIGLDKKKMAQFKVSDTEIKKFAAKAKWQELLDEWDQKKSGWLQPRDLKLKSDHFDLVVYSLGARAGDLVEGVKEQAREILREWEKENKKVWALWKKIVAWSEKGYQQTYARIGSTHDWLWHESQLYKGGKELVKKGLKKGIFRRSEGAVVSNLKKYNLPDTVLIKSDGTAIYHTFDLNLTLQKRKKFPSDLYIWDIGNEQILHLKQLFAMSEQLGIGKREDYFHLNYGYVYLKGGEKMSSRKGTIISADELLDYLHQEARKIIDQSKPQLRKLKSAKEKTEVAEKVGLAAIKYGLLKYSREKDVNFDPEESLSLTGDSGPYLQYTFARCQSVLAKAKEAKIDLPEVDIEIDISSQIEAEESLILRTLYKFPEVVLEAGQNFAPNLVCNFLYDLAQKYNLFYNRQPILKASEPLRGLRLLLTLAVAQVLKNGLEILGIEPLERM